MASSHHNTKMDVHLMARSDVAVSSRKRSSRGTLHKGDDPAVIQDCNEYGERYEWIEKSNSTSTVRRHRNRSQYRLQMTEDLKRLTKRCGCGDFRARHKARVPESGEEADDEQSAWSQFSPRSPPTLPDGLPGTEDEEVPSVVTGSKHVEIGPTRSELKGRRLLPVAKQCVTFKPSESQVPAHTTVGKKVDKTHSLPNTQIKRSVERAPTGACGEQTSVHRVATRSSHKHSSAASLDSASSDLSGGSRSDAWSCCRARPRHPCTRVDSAPLLALEKRVVYEQGDHPSTTVTFRGHVPAELLNDILFGRRLEYSCPCWPQYDVEPHIGCVARSGPNRVLLRSALSEHGRRSSRERAQLCASDACVKYAPGRRQHEATGTLSRGASQPDQRRHAATLVRFRSEPSRERPHRVNSPALQRASEAPRRPMSTRRDRAAPRTDKHAHSNKRKIIIC